MSAPFSTAHVPALGGGTECTYCGPYCPRCSSMRTTPNTEGVGFVETVPSHNLRRGVTQNGRAAPNRHDVRRAAAGDYCRADGPDCPENLRGIAAPLTQHILEVRHAGERWTVAECVLGPANEWEMETPMVIAAGDEVLFDGHAFTSLPAGVPLRVSMRYGSCQVFWMTPDCAPALTSLRHNEGLQRGRRVRDAGEEWALMCRRVMGAVAGFGVVVAAGAGHAVARRSIVGGRKTQILRAVAAGGWDYEHDAYGAAAGVLHLTLWFAGRQRRRRRAGRGEP